MTIHISRTRYLHIPIRPVFPLPTVFRLNNHHAFYGHYVACLTIDSGATGNMICLSAAKMLRVDISRSSQYAHQADGFFPLRVVGETHFTVVKGTNMNSCLRD